MFLNLFISVINIQKKILYNKKFNKLKYEY